MKRKKLNEANPDEVKAIIQDEPYYQYDKETDTVAYSLGKTIEEGAVICRKILTDLQMLQTA